jgi:polyhydroxyalkanoate synthase
MSDITMDDYLELGPLAAIEAVKSITGSPTVDIASVCLGGAMAAITAAYLSDQPETLGSITMMNTMLDYSEPGVLGCMVDPATLERLDAKMARTGFLDGGEMSLTFDMLRPNDLIFNYVVSRWLKGHKPPPFDILAWNDDSTRMPRRMHTEYLRSLYRDNELVRGEFTIKGKKLDLRSIHQDVYIIGAINDHIVPWKTSYKAVHDFGGHVRYVLSSGGHIAGIVNPPTSKGWYEAVEPNEDGTTDYPQDPEEWAANSTRHQGSWWQDWATWSTPRSGKKVKPPKMGNRTYKALGDAPGTYVLTSNSDL